MPLPHSRYFKTCFPAHRKARFMTRSVPYHSAKEPLWRSRKACPAMQDSAFREKPLENRVFRIRRKSRSKQPILADIRQKTRACQVTPQPHKNGFSHHTVTACPKTATACPTPVIRHKKTARSRYFSLLLAAHNNPVTDGTPAYLPWCSSDTVSFLRP